MSSLIEKVEKEIKLRRKLYLDNDADIMQELVDEIKRLNQHFECAELGEVVPVEVWGEKTGLQKDLETHLEYGSKKNFVRFA